MTPHACANPLLVFPFHVASVFPRSSDGGRPLNLLSSPYLSRSRYPLQARNKLMEEHIESVGADSEGIVKVNVRVLLYAFLFVVGALCAAVAAALHWEPVGLRAARVLSGRWSVCDKMCEVAAPPETPAPDGGPFSWWRWDR